MIIASGSIFISNIFLEQYLSLSNYYVYSLCITVFALLTSFGALGFEQVFLRLSEVNDKLIIFDRKIAYLISISCIVTSFISASYLHYNIDSSFILLFLLGLGITINMILYNLFRITSYFLMAQLISNSWKFVLLVFTAIIIFGDDIFDFFLISITFSLWFIIILFIILSHNFIKIKLTRNYSFKYVFLFGIIFFCSLLSLSFLAQGDRILIDSYFNKADFNKYFYLGSIFLFPFSLLQSYVGFKELVKFKSIAVNLKNLINRIIIRSVLLTIILLILSYSLAKFNIINVNFRNDYILIISFLIIGNLKMPYSLYSSMIGVKSSLTQIKLMNLYFIGISLLILILIKSLLWQIEIIPILFVVLWSTRLLLWRFYSKKISYEFEI